MAEDKQGTNGRSTPAVEGDFWDSEEMIGEVSKNARGEVIRVKRVSKRGRTYIDVRTFYPGSNGEMRPSKGISIPDNLLPAVMQLLEEARQKLPHAANATAVAE
ncbi:MAG: transcriptional coactivator p15/PC4 family protein [Limnochordales bacterium]|nr:transcriptional coactivator p15/PC4 family protein [Limnochordales bacterium]